MEGVRLSGGYPGGCPVTPYATERGCLVLRLRPATLKQEVRWGQFRPDDVLASIAAADSFRVAGIVGLQRLCPWCVSAPRKSVNLIGEPVTLPDLSTVYLARLSPTTLVRKAAADLRQWPGQKSVAPLPKIQLHYVPNDTLFPRQWNLYNNSQEYGCDLPDFNPNTDIGAPIAYDRAPNLGSGVRIGIIDSGVDSGHPDLSGRVDFGYNASAYLYWRLPWASGDSLSHGTAVAGVAAATMANTAGGAGVAPRASVVPIRTCISESDDCGHDIGPMNEAVLAGLYWAADSVPTVPIINMSFGGYAEDESYFAELATACLNGFLRGQPLIASSGNDNWSNPAWAPHPARYANRVLSVGAVFGNGLRWDDRIGPFPPGGWGDVSPVSGLPIGSNWGPYLKVVAPGGRLIVAPRSRGSFGWPIWPCVHEYFAVTSCAEGIPTGFDSLEFGGTSAAAPTVAGVAALLLAEHRLTLLGEDIAQVLMRTAVDPRTGGSSSNRSDSLGWGLVRADRALAYLEYPRVVEHLRVAGLEPVAADSCYVTFTHGVPDFDDGTYRAVRYRLTGSASFAAAYAAVPDLWVRASGSAGAADTSAFDYLVDVPTGRITDADPAGVSVETHVYAVLGVDGSLLGWHPCDPATAAVALTAVGLRANSADVGERTGLGLRMVAVPNPSVGATTLHMGIPEGGVLAVTVYDVQGRTVRRFAPRLVKGDEVAVAWDGRDDGGNRVEGGVYFARGWLNGRSRTIRIVLMPR